MFLALSVSGVSSANSEVTVLTQNLYLGASLTRVISAAGTGDFPAILAAALESLAIVFGSNDFGGRASVIASKINALHPDIVGLQEVTKITSIAGSVDFGAILLPLLPDYEVVREDSEGVIGVPTIGTLETSNMVLKRKQAALEVTSSVGTTFTTITSFMGQPIKRNWQSVDVKLNKKKVFRFINTHLESEMDEVSTAQALELIAGPLNFNQPVIAAGDFNSGPASIEQGAYKALTKKGKLRDAANVGFTCCRAELLTETEADNPDASLTERIDFVFTKSASIKVVSAERTGTQQDGGVFPSYHVVVFVRLQLH
jgi:endonuclease/exonuclease/phosphatase family metal-dependent hydrolase